MPAISPLYYESKTDSRSGFWEQQPELYDQVSLGELRRIANRHHREYMGTHRKAMRDHARLSGLALIAIKKRMRHGHWTRWLEQNFEGNPDTARVYMRVAREWDTLDDKLRTVGTLKQIREALRPEPEVPRDAPPLEGDDDGTDGAPDESADAPSGLIEVPIILPEERAEQFRRYAEALQAPYGGVSFHDAVFEAVRREANRG